MDHDIILGSLLSSSPRLHGIDEPYHQAAVQRAPLALGIGTYMAVRCNCCGHGQRWHGGCGFEGSMCVMVVESLM